MAKKSRMPARGFIIGYTRCIPRFLKEALKGYYFRFLVTIKGIRIHRKPEVERIFENLKAASTGNSAGKIPIIMCTWKRIHKLPQTMQLLEAQAGVDIHLYIWNNNTDAASEIDHIASNCHNLCVTIFHSKRNMGGFGRFFIARKLHDSYPFVIFIDDDQIFGPSMVRTFAEEFQPRTIKSFWAHSFDPSADYWKKKPVLPGKPAHYCGTGGMICDSSIFSQDKLFACPRRFWFIEDLWLSFFAYNLGWSLYKSHSSEIKIEYDDLEQNRGLRIAKHLFLKYLLKKGWSCINNKKNEDKF